MCEPIGHVRPHRAGTNPTGMYEPLGQYTPIGYVRTHRTCKLVLSKATKATKATAGKMFTVRSGEAGMEIPETLTVSPTYPPTRQGGSHPDCADRKIDIQGEGSLSPVEGLAIWTVGVWVVCGRWPAPWLSLPSLNPLSGTAGWTDNGGCDQVKVVARPEQGSHTHNLISTLNFTSPFGT